MDNNVIPNNYRDYFVGVDKKIPAKDGIHPLINFDNAATTPPMLAVINEICKFSPLYSSIHRGSGFKSEYTSALYDDSRRKIAEFIGADIKNNSIIYVKNTTEAINKLAFKLYTREKSVILSSDMEHHSNDLPWRGKYYVDYLSLGSNGSISISDLEKKLKKYSGKIRLVTITGASNVTGIINPVYDIAELTHKYGTKLFVDCAQLVPHKSFSMMPDNHKNHVDYIAFSGHKMYAPFGVGVLIGPKSSLNAREPEYKGGGTVRLVTHKYINWEDTPVKDEAGTPNVMGVIALVTAIDILCSIGMHNVEAYEDSLAKYALKKLQTIPEIILYGNDFEHSNRIGIIPFNINGLHHAETAAALSDYGIAVRNGCFCAQPYVKKLLQLENDDVRKYINSDEAERPGMLRVSFGLYNTIDEIDQLIIAIAKIINNRNIKQKHQEQN